MAMPGDSPVEAPRDWAYKVREKQSANPGGPGAICDQRLSDAVAPVTHLAVAADEWHLGLRAERIDSDAGQVDVVHRADVHVPQHAITDVGCSGTEAAVAIEEQRHTIESSSRILSSRRASTPLTRDRS